MVKHKSRKNLTNLSLIIDAYDAEVMELSEMHQNKGGGKARSASGKAFENLICRICSDNNLIAKKNDYKRTRELDGVFLNNLQVDKHIYRDGIMVKAVESKAYLDSCYLKRAVSDFIEMHFSPDVPSNVEYAIFTGQLSVAQDSLKYYSAFFHNATGKTFDLFVVNKVKKRNSKQAIYMEQYNNNFGLDVEEIKRFVEWLNH